jgi:small basic protein
MLSLIIALLTPKQYLWKSQVFFFGLIAVVLPIYNLVYLINHRLISDLSSYWLFLRVDLFLLICAVFAIFIFRNIQPIQEKSIQKIKTKLAQNKVKA